MNWARAHQTAERCTLLLLLLVEGSAWAATGTCHEDEHGNRTCCTQWKAQVFEHGKPWGLEIEKTYERLEHSIESGKKFHKWFCKASGLGPSQGSCHMSWGTPQCANSKSVAAPNPSPLEEADVLQGAARMLNVWAGILASAGFEHYKAREGVPLRGTPGSVLAEYVSTFDEARKQAEKLQKLLEHAHENAAEHLLRNIGAMTYALGNSASRVQQLQALLSPQQKQVLAGSPANSPAQSAAPPTENEAPVGRAQPPRSVAPKSQSCLDLSEQCLNVLDSTWDDSDSTLRSRGSGRLIMRLENTCSTAVRVVLWSQGSGVPSFFGIPSKGRITRQVVATGGDWKLAASSADASDECLAHSK